MFELMNYKPEIVEAVDAQSGEKKSTSKKRGLIGNLLHGIAWTLRKAADLVSGLEENYIEIRPRLLAGAKAVALGALSAAGRFLLDGVKLLGKGIVALGGLGLDFLADAILFVTDGGIGFVASCIAQEAMEFWQAIKSAWAFRSELVAEAYA